MGRACSFNGEKRNACGILVENPEGKRPLGIPRSREEDNIMTDLRDGVVWTESNWVRIGTSGGFL
jgi:hypothetical protein